MHSHRMQIIYIITNNNNMNALSISCEMPFYFQSVAWKCYLLIWSIENWGWTESSNYDKYSRRDIDALHMFSIQFDSFSAQRHNNTAYGVVRITIGMKILEKHYLNISNSYFHRIACFCFDWSAYWTHVFFVLINKK